MREEGRRRGMREEASVTVFGSGSRAQLHGQPHRRGGWVIRPVCGAKGKNGCRECSALTLPHPGPHEFQTPSLGRAFGERMFSISLSN